MIIQHNPLEPTIFGVLQSFILEKDYSIAQNLWTMGSSQQLL
jgi:hypothetical protein